MSDSKWQWGLGAAVVSAVILIGALMGDSVDCDELQHQHADIALRIGDTISLDESPGDKKLRKELEAQEGVIREKKYEHC